jgi:hypothetical protein
MAMRPTYDDEICRTSTGNSITPIILFGFLLTMLLAMIQYSGISIDMKRILRYLGFCSLHLPPVQGRRWGLSCFPCALLGSLGSKYAFHQLNYLELILRYQSKSFH